MMIQEATERAKRSKILRRPKAGQQGWVRGGAGAPPPNDDSESNRKGEALKILRRPKAGQQGGCGGAAPPRPTLLYYYYDYNYYYHYYLPSLFSLS